MYEDRTESEKLAGSINEGLEEVGGCLSEVTGCLGNIFGWGCGLIVAYFVIMVIALFLASVFGIEWK